MNVQDELNRLRAENEALKAKVNKASPFGMKVGAKGGVSIFGMGRFPVTLYAQQWQRLLARSADILAFIEAHKSELATKA